MLNYNFLKAALAALLSLVFISIPVYSVTYTYNDSWDDPGWNVISQSTSAVEIIFSIGQITINDVIFDGDTVNAIDLPGCFSSNEIGKPSLPGCSRLIAIPE